MDWLRVHFKAFRIRQFHNIQLIKSIGKKVTGFFFVISSVDDKLKIFCTFVEKKTSWMVEKSRTSI